jgi:3-hydroxyacyl-CoA dehydrogenase/enoyl-CoA hydratase/carnithine racemase
MTRVADEVVTRSLVRFLDVPGIAGELALITIDNGLDHTRPSTFGPAGLASLDSALDAIAAHTPAVAAIAITGKPFVFAVGADLSGVPLITNREQAREIGALGHRVFRRLKDGLKDGPKDSLKDSLKNSRVPTFAFVNGAVLGGGLELALHCDYRTLARSAAAIAFPEVFLGLVPGWGGTQLLPRLIGPDAAVAVIVDNPLNQNKMLTPKQAAELGIVDELLDVADFLAQSLAWAATVLDGSTPIDRADHADDDWDAAVARGRKIADAKVHGSAPAPYRALELIAAARTADFTDGTAAEDDALADLIMSDELRAGLYAFDLVQKRAKRPAGAPDKVLARKVTKVGVVGAGLMASQLALLFARQLEVPVVLTDLDQGRLDKGVGYVHRELDEQLAKGRISADRANRLKALVTGSLTKDAFSDADFVIEAVFEELEIKKQVFADVEQYVSPETVLATNTSSLSITEMAADLQRPERVVGFHFFNPVAVLPLLEIVRGELTDDATLATAFAVSKALKKSSVLVKDAPAFVVNRLLTRFLGEVTKTVDEGTAIEVADRALDPLGLPMSPFVLLQLVGPAVALHVAETMHAAFPERYSVSPNLRRLVEAKKSGIYVWDEQGQRVDPEVEALFVGGDSPSSAEQVRERALSAIAQEVRIMLDEGVVAEAEDIDLCLLLGAGWPFHNGGITPYLDRTGLAERVTGRRFLAPGVASVPA